MDDKLQKYYGEINWFRGFNKKTGKQNDFGFIDVEDKLLPVREVFFHRSELKFKEELCVKGEIVSFEVIINNDNYNAINFNLLEHEDSQEVLLDR